MESSAAPRMLRLITYSFLTLAEFGLNLVDLPRFLTDRQWRQSLVSCTKHREVGDYFHHEFPTKEGAVHQWITPVLNKIGPLIFDPDVRLMLATRSTINFREILDRKMVLLVNLSKGLPGEGNSALLGAFIVAHLQQAALSRANSQKRDIFFLYLDEFQNYTTDNIRDVLGESRKYGLSLILAHQYLDQLSPDLRGAVLNIAGPLVCFRLGYNDASMIAREVFPPGHLKSSRREQDSVKIGPYSVPVFKEQSEPLGHEALITKLTQLKPREFWIKRRGPYLPVKQRALYMPEPQLSEELYQARKDLIERVGQQFGRLKREIKEELQHGREDDDDADHSTTYYEEA